jgi:hypothetical protein
MKVKWRAHERLLVTCMTLLSTGILAVQYFSRPHFLLPQAGSLLLVYAGYLWLNFGIIPMAVKAATHPARRWLRVIGVFAQLFVLTYILGPVVNFISFYAGPGYKGFDGIPLTFGFHPQPLLNAFGGWEVAVVLVSFYLAYALVREVAVHYLERPGPLQTYRALVGNKVSAFAGALLGLPFLVAAFQLANPVFYHYYFALVPPAALLLLVGYYRLFPAHEGKNVQDLGFLMKLLLCAVGITLPFSLFLGGEWTPGLFTGMVAAQLLIILPLSWFRYQAQKDTILQLRGSQRELARSKADLGTLRSQINPHFLYNALNSLYATALREKSPDTAAGIQQLGDMMRFMLHDNQQDLIPMGTELDYLSNYIALQKLRVQESDDMVIEVHISDKDCSFLIAPMLLIPFVENAFKHGISLEQKSWIRIGLECDGAQLSFKVRNSLHPALMNDTEQGKSGIGLQNVQERLQLLYPGRHELHYGPQADEFVVTLKITTNS